ncbi:hypothetical protein PUN4_550069 [Paraburkholderia unamae]|nr:hypothetical protein PUN4_550069 [Paraburkholderia unamae]
MPHACIVIVVRDVPVTSRVAALTAPCQCRFDLLESFWIPVSVSRFVEKLGKKQDLDQPRCHAAITVTGAQRFQHQMILERHTIESGSGHGQLQSLTAGGSERALGHVCKAR